MTLKQLLAARLRNQGIAEPRFQSPLEVVTHLGAMQAQDYEGALWAIGLRLPDSTREEIVRAVESRQIVRTWPMRGTLHFVPAQDLRWMLKLTAAKMIRSTASRYRQLELDDAVFRQARKRLTNFLEGGKQLPRSAIFSLFSKAGIDPVGQRGVHILGRLCMEGLLCQSGMIAKEPAFALLDEWVEAAPELEPGEALGILTSRYFQSHGPARLEDFMRWSGLTKTEAKKGLEVNGDRFKSEKVGETIYWLLRNVEAKPLQPRVDLLPGFDEYMLGYTDRTPALDLEHHPRIVPGNNGVFMPTVVIDGKVEGLWKRAKKPRKVVVTIDPFAAHTPAQTDLLEKQLRRYGQFLGVETELQV